MHRQRSIIFGNTSCFAAMKIYIDVVDMRMDAFYEVCLKQGDTRTKEEIRFTLLIQSNNLIGEAYEAMDNPFASIPYYLKAAQLADESGNIEHIGRLYCNLGLAQKRCDMYSLAKKSYEKSLSVIQGFNLEAVEQNYQKLLKEMEEWTGTSGKLAPHC